jgi:hypothetical protein
MITVAIIELKVTQEDCMKIEKEKGETTMAVNFTKVLESLGFTRSDEKDNHTRFEPGQFFQQEGKTVATNSGGFLYGIESQVDLTHYGFRKLGRTDLNVEFPKIA